MKLFSFLNKKITPKTNGSISSLAPRVLTEQEDIDKIQPYLNKIKETLDADGINNIAITGSYGSGKSTIIKTFFHLNSNYKPLTISLAAFNNDEKLLSKSRDKRKLEKEELERLLEVSILQQIFYHVEPSKIPESRFKRIIDYSWRKLLIICTVFVLWMLSIILLLKFDYLNQINPNNWNIKLSFNWVALISNLVAFIGFGFLFKYIIQLFSNSRINKVNIKGELELGESVNKSVFNEHLEEIMYFFESTEFDVVVIEDLDRFENTKIFTKLREINILLNNSKLIREKREVNFIYAVGDQLFKDKKERVKFFEYIIPIIPFINSSNANEQLHRLIKESGLKESIFSRAFMSDITTFIDDIDMRLLINIFHEFVIYRQIQKPEFIKKPEELFSIITYKNIEPSDFVELNNKQGKLFDLVNKKKSYIEKIIDELELEIEDKFHELSIIKNHLIEDIKELKSIYLTQILSKIPIDSVLKRPIEELLDDNNFEELKNSVLYYEKFTLNRNYGNMYNKSEIKLNFKFKNIEDEVDFNHTYEERLELIKSKNNSRIISLQIEIENLKKKRAKIETWDLKQIFQEIEVDQYLNEFSNNALLRSLILNGYINENYNDYISLFHEGSITKEDLIFERNVKGGYFTNYNYKLTELEGLLDRINPRYFNREYILNFDLVDFLGRESVKYSDLYNLIIQLLSNEREKSISFIDEYIKDETRPIGIFIERLTEKWHNFFKHVSNKSEYTPEKVNNYLKLIFTHVKEKTIIESQDKESLSKSIENNPQFLSLIKSTEESDFFEKLSSLIKNLNIKFEELENPNEGTNKLFNYVYENNHYKITQKNILQMLKVYNDEVVFDNFNTKNYSTIKGSNCNSLITYIEEEINFYIENIFLKLENNTLEEESYLIELLNNKNLDIENKDYILNKVETKIIKLYKIIDPNVHFILLIDNKVAPSWENLLFAYENQLINEDETDKIIPESIIDYINVIDNANELSKSKVPKEVNSINIYGVFWKKLIQIDEIEDESYDLITKSSPWLYSNLKFENLSIAKIESLINNGCIGPTIESFDLLKKDFNGFNINLLESKRLEYFKILNELTFDSYDLELVLKSSILSNSEKVSILDKCSEDIIITDENLKQLSIILLSDKPIKINENILVEILNNNNVPVESRLKLFIKNYYNYDISFVKSFLLNLEDNYSKITDTSLKAKLPINDINKQLLTILKNKNYISSFSDKKSFYMVNHKRK